MNVDEQVVDMKFNNQEFERRAGATFSTLSRLKDALHFPGASRGLEDVQRSMGRFSAGPMLGALDGVSKGFIALSAVAITALTRITNKIIDVGGQLIKSLSVAPVVSGLHEYETTLNSVQTILANTGLEGQKGLDKVNGALLALNKYSDKTIYNFGQMAKNIGTFTAAGVGLDVSTQAIKGIANLAALSGSSAEQASTGMYQLSQALSTGTVRLMDWNSVSNAGFGGKVFQESIKETARVHGVNVDKMIKEEGSFRDSLQRGWFTSEILTETLQKFTGDLSDKQLASLGYTEDQIKGIQKMAKTATDAATKVKTFTQLTGTLQEAAGSGWAKTWQLIFGDFGEAKKLFTGVNDVLGGFIQASANARNKVLGDWKELGGRTVLIEAISDAFHAVLRVIRPIKHAFRDLFPRKTGQDLFDITEALGKFAESLKIGDDTMEDLRRTFRGVFAIFDIGFQIVSAIWGVFKDLFGVVSDGSGGFLELTGDIGDFLYNLSQTLEKTGAIEKFFGNLKTVLAVPLVLLRAIAGAFGQLFQGLDITSFDKIGGAIGDWAERMSPIEKIAKIGAKAWDVLVGVLKKVGDFLKPFADAFTSVFEGLGKGLSESLKNGNFNAVLQIINTALLGGILLLVRKFFKKIFAVDLGTGVIGGLKDLFGELGNTLKAFQDQIKSKTLLTIAIAIGILTVSLIALSGIDKEELGKALTAIAGLMGALLSAFTTIGLIGSGKGFLKIPAIAGALVLLAGAILILTVAMKILASMSWEEIAKGLTAVSGLLLGLSLAVKPISANAGGMIRAGLGIIAIAVALNILALAVKIFSLLSWEELAKGVGAAVLSLLAISGATRLLDPATTFRQSAAVIAIAIAMKILASAVADFAEMDIKELGKGLTAIALTLGILAGAMAIMPKDILLQAIALNAIATSLIIIGQALRLLGSTDTKVLGVGLLTMAAALGLLAGALFLMNGSLAGAAALIIATGALAILAPVLKKLGGMTWVEIAKGLIAIAGAFIILGLAGLILAPLAPAILSLSASLLAVGGALVLAGAGALAFATAFAIFIAAATVGIGVLTGLIQLIPILVENFVLGIVAFVTTLAQNSATLFSALGLLIYRFITTLLDIVIKVAPKIAQAIGAVVKMVITVLRNNVPALVDTGYDLIISLLKIIRDHIGEFIEVGVDIILEMSRGLRKKLPDLIQEGFDLVIDFVNALADKIDENAEDVGRAGGRLAVAIGKGLIKGIWGLLDELLDAVTGLAQAALDKFQEIFKIFSPSHATEDMGEQLGAGLVKGLVSSTSSTTAEAGKMAKKTLSGLDNELNKWSMANLDIQPRMTPVLDLSQVQRDAPKLKSLLDMANESSMVTLASSIGTSGSPLSPNRGEEAKDESRSIDVKLEQTINSPKPVDDIEVFRGTRNQLSLLEEVLKSEDF